MNKRREDIPSEMGYASAAVFDQPSFKDKFAKARIVDSLVECFCAAGFLLFRGGDCGMIRE